MLETRDAQRPELVGEQELAAPWARVVFGPAEDWPEVNFPASSVPAREGDHQTILTWERRIDVDSGRSFHATAVRLETAIGVQHESQWSVELDARTERLTLHWLRVVRDGRRVDHLRRECMRLLQRETEMERLVLSGRWTLLAVLDDVRVGDVIEAAYSYQTTHPIRGRGCEALFALPPQAMIGSWRLVLRGAEAAWAGLRWKASAEVAAPREDLSEGRRSLTWSGTQTAPREAEPNAPANCFDHLWVLISDLADWGELAAAAAAAWARVGDEAGLDEDPALARPEAVNAAAIIRLVSHFQEHFRYLSLDLQAGGWVPSAPGAVTRRRHGDCKDLAWLAATVLRRWGVAARPILVGSGFRERVAELLPMAMAFNHAILEVSWEGRTRWFDLTERGQGGDFDGRAVGWFGFGLPVDVADNALKAQPGARAPSVYAWRELILLDTRPDASSMTEQQVRVEGGQADAWRRQRAAQGAELFAKDREELARQRYGRALKRVGAVQWRDDPVANVCELAEVFEFSGAVHPAELGGRVVFQVPPCLVAMWFGLPEEKARRLPWAMPYPLEVRHVIEVRTGERSTATPRRRRWDEAEFEAVSEATGSTVGWRWAYRFVVKKPEVAAERVAKYRALFQEVLTECAWRLTLPRGRARPKRSERFGDLPAQGEATQAARAEAAALSGDESEEMKAARAKAAADAKRGGGRSSGSGGGSASGSSGRGRRSSHGRSRRSGGRWAENIPGGVFRVGFFVLLGLVFGVLKACIRSGGGGGY